MNDGRVVLVMSCEMAGGVHDLRNSNLGMTYYLVPGTVPSSKAANQVLVSAEIGTVSHALSRLYECWWGFDLDIIREHGRYSTSIF